MDSSKITAVLTLGTWFLTAWSKTSNYSLTHGFPMCCIAANQNGNVLWKMLLGALTMSPIIEPPTSDMYVRTGRKRKKNYSEVGDSMSYNTV